MKYRSIFAAFFNTPHAIMPEKLAEIEAFLTPKFLAKAKASKEESEPKAGPRDGVQMVGRVAVVPVMGVLAQRMGMMGQMSGGTSTEQLGATIDNLVADRGVKAILLNIDSPGGSVFGIPELGAKILVGRDEKKIVAFANSTAASAAYWLASQCSEIVVTTGGRVGSIGVIAAHTDESKAEEMQGIKTTYITAGKFKGEGMKPLTDDSQAAMQAEVNTLYDSFVAAVAKGRGVTANRVESDFGQGRMKFAKDAVESGMADRVATLEQTLRRMGGDDAARGAAAARERTAQMAAMGLPT